MESKYQEIRKYFPNFFRHAKIGKILACAVMSRPKFQQVGDAKPKTKYEIRIDGGALRKLESQSIGKILQSKFLHYATTQLENKKKQL